MNKQINAEMATGCGCLSLIGLVSLLGLAKCSYETIDEGNVGLKVRFGEVISKEPLQPGLHFVFPFVDDIVVMNTQTKLINKEVIALTRDTQRVLIKFSLGYNLNPDYATRMYKEVGIDYQPLLIDKLMYNSFHKAIGKISADDLLLNKDKMTASIKKELTDELKDKGIHVSALNLTELTFTPEYMQTAERKMVAYQQALVEKYNTLRQHELANQKIEVARGDTESRRMLAETETFVSKETAKQKIEIARAESIAKKSMADAESYWAQATKEHPHLLDYELIRKWNGNVPVTLGDNHSFLFHSGFPFLFNTGNTSTKTGNSQGTTDKNWRIPLKISTQTPHGTLPQSQNTQGRGSRE